MTGDQIQETIIVGLAIIAFAVVLGIAFWKDN